jgi:hypothetical protein
MTRGEERDLNLEIGLLVIRVTSASLFLVWSVDKIVDPEHAPGVIKANSHLIK